MVSDTNFLKHTHAGHMGSRKMVSDTNFYLWERRFTQGHFAEEYLPAKTVQRNRS
jgi:hypothetical protein